MSELDEDSIIENPINDAQYYRGDKNVPKEDAQFEWTPKMVKELKKCKENIVHFAENHFYIVTLDDGKKKIQLYKAQKRALKSLSDNRFVCVLASRQCGKTTMSTIYALWNTCFYDDQRVIVVANKESTAINIFKRIRMAYELLPNYLKPGVKEYGKTGVTFANGSSIGISTTTSTAARGDTASILIIDEAAFIDPNFMEEFWKSVIPIVSSGKKTKIFMVSTPNGTGNKFYEIYSGAEKGANGWKGERIDWWDVPGRGEKWKKQMIAALGSDDAFQQEFGNIFLDATNSAVGAAVIEKFKENRKPPIWESEDGYYRVFHAPSPEKIYVIGVDVGEGIGRAASVAQILDVTDLTNIKQTAVFSTNVTEPYYFANQLNILLNSWGRPPILIERNNCGAQVIDTLFHKHQYEKIISYSKLSNTGSYANTRHLGVYSHNNLRFSSVANMRYWLNFLEAVWVDDIDTIKELETFVRYPNGTYRKKNDKFYDDRVMALNWALFILEPDICERYFNIEEFDEQGKPSKILPGDYYDPDPNLYAIRDLKTNITITNPERTLSTEQYTPLITEEELNTLYENSDYDELLSLGFKPL
jgi:hypothetical protein